MGARASRHALLVAAALWLALPACVFPPWDGQSATNDDDDSAGESAAIALLCEMADTCGTSPWSSVDECLYNYPTFIEDCTAATVFLDCGMDCVELDCPEFIDCHDACVETYCWQL
jgi:hypothetical protein